MIREADELDLENLRDVWERSAGSSRPLESLKLSLSPTNRDLILVDPDARRLLGVSFGQVELRTADGARFRRNPMFQVFAMLPENMGVAVAVGLLDSAVEITAERYPDLLDVTFGGYMPQSVMRAIRRIYGTVLPEGQWDAVRGTGEVAGGRWLIWSTVRLMRQNKLGRP